MIVALCLFCYMAVSPAQEMRELGSDHFIVYFTADEKFAREVSDKAELYYNRIASDLGYPRYSGFWTWDNRVKIYIYPDHNSFLKASNQPSWSHGMADYTNKSILSYSGSERFIDGMLPHETAHLIFRDFVGFKGEVPVWLDEGVAQWAEPLKREMVKDVSRQLLDSGKFFSVKDMVNLDIRKVASDDTVKIRSIRGQDGKRVLFSLRGDAVVNTYYIEAVSLVGFLIGRYGASSFTDFCRQLRDGKSLEEALRFAYPTRINNIEELEDAWLKYLQG